MTTRDDVTDWATDFDHTHPDYAAQAPEIWDKLRSECPVAHSDRFGGTWLPTRHEDIKAIAGDTRHFTSRGVVVSDDRPEIPGPVGFAPPITSDPPFHEVARRLLLPAFSPKAIAELEDGARASCNQLIDELLSAGDIVDAAEQYAQHIPVRVIAQMLGLPAEDGDRFREFIHRIITEPGQHQVAEEDTLGAYLDIAIADRQENPRDDLISFLCQAELGGQPLDPDHVSGTIALLLIAGIDTTWSAIGASLWHLAQNPDDRQRWVADPAVRPFAIEEFLRFYAPVTMARMVAEPIEFAGCPMKTDDWVLLPFPAANRDPEAFERAGEFVIDRERNRHGAFGLGIHRCLGSNLARLELTVAIEEWMNRIPDFELADPEGVTWSTGQIRGPRSLPVRLLNVKEQTP